MRTPRLGLGLGLALLVGCGPSPSSTDAADAAPATATTGEEAPLQASPPEGAPTADPERTEHGETPEAAATAPQRPPAAPAAVSLVSGPASPRYLDMAREIQAEVACVRGRPFEKDVGVEFQSLDDFGAFLDRELAKEFGGDKGPRQQRLLHAVGLIGPEVDLESVLRQATLDQAAAYYDPETDTFYVVQEMPELALQAVMAHELQHALQDQHTTLLDRYTKGEFESLDAELAARFLVEGEATLVGHAWTMRHVSDTYLAGLGAQYCALPGQLETRDAALFWGPVGDMVSEQASQTRQEIQEPGLLAKLATRAMSRSMARSMAMLQTLPNFVFYTLLLPYQRGARTVYVPFAASGHDWSTIDALFARPPETTEQALHPTKLSGTREPFTAPRLPAPEKAPYDTSGWTADRDDRIGELGLWIWLMEGGIEETVAMAAAEGWGGDTVRVFHRDDDPGTRLAFHWAIDMDNPVEADELRRHVSVALLSRHPELVWGEGAEAALAGNQRDGAASYTWADADGATRHGRVTWSGAHLELTEGWLAPLR